MDAHDLIERILDAHEHDDDSMVSLRPALTLEPQLDYSGKMAERAYIGRRRHWRKKRPYIGILDFRIFVEGKKLEHGRNVIRPAVVELSIDNIRLIHEGADPERLQGLSESHKSVASCIQAAFVEQELNWGEEDFQLRTYFGRTDTKDDLLRMAAPRDYQMVFIEKCDAEVKSKGKEKFDAVNEVLERYRRYSGEAGGEVIMPPLDSKKRVEEEFRPYMPPSIRRKSTEKWIEPHVERVREMCRRKGTNPH